MVPPFYVPGEESTLLLFEDLVNASNKALTSYSPGAILFTSLASEQRDYQRRSLCKPTVESAR